MLAGLVIGLPPVLNFGSPELISRVVPDVSHGATVKIYSLMMWICRLLQARNILLLPFRKPSQVAMLAGCRPRLCEMAMTG